MGCCSSKHEELLEQRIEEEIRRRRLSSSIEFERQQREQIRLITQKSRLEAQRQRKLHLQQQQIREQEELLERQEKERIEEIRRRRAIDEELERKQREQIFIRQHAQARLETQREEQQRNLNLRSQHKVTKNLQLLNDLRKAFGLHVLESYPSKPYEETRLDSSSSEYHDVYFRFKQGNKRFFTVSKINKVNNTFHVLQYNLMRNKYQNVYRDYGQEVSMYHGTKSSNLNGICTFNFDRSKVRTHKFGFGTSFAKDSYYATHYHQDNKRNLYKVMVMAKVYYGEVQHGNKFTTIPDEPCYTSTNNQESVIVKYDDATAYPVYIIHYTGMHPYQPKRRNR